MSEARFIGYTVREEWRAEKGKRWLGSHIISLDSEVKAYAEACALHDQTPSKRYSVYLGRKRIHAGVCHCPGGNNGSLNRALDQSKEGKKPNESRH